MRWASWTQVGDEVTFVQAITPDAFDRADFTFFCGTEEMTHRHWKRALEAGSDGARSLGRAGPRGGRAGCARRGLPRRM